MFERALFGPFLKVFSHLSLKPLKSGCNEDSLKKDIPNGKPQQQLIWLNIISIFLLHVWAIHAAYVCFKELTQGMLLWGLFYGYAGGFGVTAGAHRLWAHRSYKAKLPYKLLVLYFFTASGQNSVYDWVRDHRVHHKYSETDADPHNANRGFFFSHVGWLMMKKHPEVYAKGSNVDMSDIENDPLLAFQRKYFVILKILSAFVIPTVIPPLVWGAPWKTTFLSICVIRYVLLLNITWSVNSAAHIWGNHPFDKRIQPAENVWVSIISLGEGWHNYHHVFPWDYKASEFGPYFMNITTRIIDFAAKYGLVYDRKQPSKDLIAIVAKKHGDGSWKGHMECPEPQNVIQQDR